jgi:flagellar biosynthesis protein FliQ
MAVTIALGAAAIAGLAALVLLGRWVLSRIRDYPATIFGPLHDPMRRPS